MDRFYPKIRKGEFPNTPKRPGDENTYFSFGQPKLQKQFDRSAAEFEKAAFNLQNQLDRAQFANNQGNLGIANAPNFGPNPYYGQLNMFRFNPQESQVFGNDQSNFPITPRAVMCGSAGSAKAQKEHPVAQGEKLGETSFRGNLTFGQGSMRTLNIHSQEPEMVVVKVEKDVQSGGSGFETSHKRTFDNSSPKFIADKQRVSGGMRIFTGSVEKVLKWYGNGSPESDYVFEVIGKCINVFSGRDCEKFILIRDNTGPVLHVVYYEVDFVLPEITIGTILRVVGKMKTKNRMFGYKVRNAMDSEITALPRLCALSHNIITKLQASNASR